MNWLEIYGTPIYNYRGKGTLTDKFARNVNVNFEVAQLFDGRTFCELKSESHELHDAQGECNLSGVTEYGYSLEITRLIPLSTHILSGLTIYSIRAIAASSVTLQTTNSAEAESAFETKFLITNFNFFSKFGPQIFIWNFHEYEVVLQPLLEHKENTQLIRATNNTGLTSTIQIRSVRGISEIPQAENLVTRLCWLLSLAQGCFISWICHESFANDKVIERSHRSLPLMPPSGLQLIPSEPVEFSNYIEHCMQIYDEKELSWQLTRLIDIYVRAATTQPFLEVRGIQLAVFMDYMRGIYARADKKDRLIDEQTFESIKADLKSKLAEILKALLPSTKSDLRKKMLRHIGMFQWYPFGDVVKGMAKKLRLKLSDAEIDSFVTERDHLVHTYGFTGEDPLLSCNRMTSVASKFMLALLEYEGDFYDWAIPAKGDWKNRTVKLDLR